MLRDGLEGITKGCPMGDGRLAEVVRRPDWKPLGETKLNDLLGSGPIAEYDLDPGS